MSTNEIVAGKEAVVRRRGADWSFHLPAQHEIEVNAEHNFVSLSMPLAGSTYQLAGITETDDEVIVALGDQLIGHATSVGENVPPTGYPLPEIQDEFERLHGRWTQAGLPQQDFHAYAAGSTHEDKLRDIRRQLREANA